MSVSSRAGRVPRKPYTQGHGHQSLGLRMWHSVGEERARSPTTGSLKKKKKKETTPQLPL